MIESKLNEFFRSPKGILLVVGILMLFAISVLLFTARVFGNLVDQSPTIY